MAKRLLSLLALILVWAPAGLEAKTVTDSAGRRVEVPERVERLVALGSAMGFVSYLQAQDLVVGVEAVDQRGDLAKPYIIVNRERFRNLPVVGTGSSQRLHNYEEIIRLKPDLVFLVTTTPGEADSLQRKLRRPVVVLSSGFPAFEPETFLGSIQLAGDLLGRPDRARELVDYLRSLPGQLAPRPAGKAAVRAYVGGLSNRGSRDLTSTIADSWPMRLAGLINLMDDSRRQGQLFINKEHLLSLNPPLIFVDSGGLALIRESVRREPGFYARLQAFKNNRVWLVLPHTSYLSNPEIMYINAFLMAKAAYPDLYGEIDPQAKADEIFTRFFGAPLYQYYLDNHGGFGRLELKGSEIELLAP